MDNYFIYWLNKAGAPKVPAEKMRVVMKGSAADADIVTYVCGQPSPSGWNPDKRLAICHSSKLSVADSMRGITVRSQL